MAPPSLDDAPAWAVPYGREFWRDPVQAGAEIDVARVIDRVSHAFRLDERSVARMDSARYAAEVDGTGLRFLPSREPGERASGEAVRIRTASVRRDGARVDESGPAPWSILGNTAQSRLREDGALVVHHEARSAGVEITWVLQEEPAGRGSLCVALALSGARWSSDSEKGHHFVDASGSPLLRVSRSVAVDALGRRWPLASRASGGELSIEVPEAVLAAAAFPLAIDPVVSPDIVVTDLGYVPDDADQLAPEIAFGGGVWMVAWRDETSENSNNFDVTATRVGSDGVPLDPRGLNIVALSQNQTISGIAFDGTNFLLVWEDRRDGAQFDVYGRLVRASDGTVLGAANGTPLIAASGNQSQARLTFDGTHYLLVWTDQRNGNLDVYGARVDPADLSVEDGTGVPIRAVAGVSESLQDVAFDGTHHLVLWTDSRDAATLGQDLYAARVSTSTGLVVLDTAGFPVAAETANQTEAQLLFDGTRYFAVWTDQRGGTRDVYATRIETDTTIVDVPHIAVDAGANDQRSASIAFDGARYVILYRHDTTTVDAIRVVRVNAVDGSVVDSPAVTLASGVTILNTPSISSDGTTLLALWTAYRDPSEQDVVGTRLAPDTLAMLDPISIFSTQPGSEVNPAVASDGTNHLIVFQHLDGNQYDLYGARVRADDGALLDVSPILVSGEEDSQISPSVTFDGTRWFVVWADDRIPGGDVYGVRVETNGGVGTEVAVNTEAGSASEPVVAVSGTTFLIAWTDTRNGSSDIYASRVRATDLAVLDATAIPVATPSGSAQFDPDVAGDGSGFLVVWDDRRVSSSGDIYASRIDTNGVIVAADRIVASGVTQQVQPAVAFDGTNHLVVWRNAVSGGDTDIGGNRVRASDAAVLDGAGGVLLFDDALSQLEIDIAFAETGFLLVWQGAGVYAARVRASDLQLLDPTGFAVSETSRIERAPAVSWGGERFLVAYDSFDSSDQSAFVRARLVQESEPIAGDDAGETPEDMALSVGAPGVLANDSDPTGDPLVAVLATGPVSGTLTLDPDGSYLYTPDPDFHGADSFQYVASDGISESLPATVTLTVTPVNDAPVAAADEGTVAEDGMLSVAAPGVLANDSDVDGDTLRAVLDTTVAFGTLTLGTDGAYVYTPDADFSGSDAFTYHVTDGVTTSPAVTVDLTVTAVNDGPVLAAPSSAEVAEDGVFSFTGPAALSATDVDAGAQPVAMTLSVSLGTLTLADTAGLTFTTGDGADDPALAFTGTLAAIGTALDGMTYAPGQDANGEDALLVAIDDGGNTGGGSLTDSASVSLSVLPVNDAPANGVPGEQSVDEDAELVLTLTVADVDPGALEVTLAALHGAITLTTSAGLTFTVGDGDADPLLVFEGPPAAITAALEGLRYRAAADYFGDDELTLTTDDLGNGGDPALTDEDVVAISVAPVNDAPSAPVPSAPADGEVLDERAPVLVVTNAADVDDATLSYAFEVRSEEGEVVASASGVPGGATTTTWTVDPPLKRGRVYTWTVTASDVAGASATSAASSFEIEPAMKKASSCACSLSGGGSSPAAAPFVLAIALGAVFLARRREPS